MIVLHFLWWFVQLVGNLITGVIGFGLLFGKLEIRRVRKRVVQQRTRPTFVACRHKGGRADCPPTCMYIYGSVFATEKRVD